MSLECMQEAMQIHKYFKTCLHITAGWLHTKLGITEDFKPYSLFKFELVVEELSFLVVYKKYFITASSQSYGNRKDYNTCDKTCALHWYE